MATLANRGRVVHGYPATRGHEDALALLRREVDAGAAPTGRTLDALQEANAAALDALARIGDGASAPPCGQSGTSRWCPHPLGHGGPCTVDWAVVEGPERRNLSEAEFNEEGVAFAPFVTEEQKGTFLDALTREAEKRVLVMSTGEDLERYASEAAPSGVGTERVGSREWTEEKGAE